MSGRRAASVIELPEGGKRLIPSHLPVETSSRWQTSATQFRLLINLYSVSFRWELEVVRLFDPGVNADAENSNGSVHTAPSDSDGNPFP